MLHDFIAIDRFIRIDDVAEPNWGNHKNTASSNSRSIRAIMRCWIPTAALQNGNELQEGNVMNVNELTAETLAGMIDQTLLKPDATLEQLRKHCEGAAKYHFKTVAINNAPVPFCKKILEGTGVLCDAAVSFPLGQCTIETKVFETIDVIEKGAGEVDYVVNLVELKSGNWDYVEEEMRRVVEACRERGITSKVIFENCYLTDDEKKKLCEVALRVKPVFIKTSTGFGTHGATVDDVRLMKSCVGDKLLIKAAGGIRTAEQALAMIEAGASRIGTSRGIEIVEGFKSMQNTREKQ